MTWLISDGGEQTFGACTHCGNPARKEAHLREDGVTVIEKYCEECMQPDRFESLQKWYGSN